MKPVWNSSWVIILTLLPTLQCSAQKPLKKAATPQIIFTGGEPEVASPRQPATGPLAPTSLFDAVNSRMTPISVTVNITATESGLEPTEPAPYEAGAQEVLTTAGSYGDILRFLQTLPGVVASNDTSNEVLVRGGHPMENLYVVDGIEMANINHVATLGTTGGFAPMIDAAAIQGLKLSTGGYDAGFPERLSSVTEIRLLDAKSLERHLEGDFGIQGVGGLVEQRIHGGDLLVSGHHGLLDTVTQDAGMSGVPTYTNALTRYRRRNASGNQFTLLNVAGWDSIDVTPCQSDQVETSSINSQYSGWRETTGIAWQHVYSKNSFAVASISDSEQVEHIHQQDQYVDPTKASPLRMACPIPKELAHTTPVYMEDTNNGYSSAAYRFEFGTVKLTFATGTTGWLQRPHFDIAQPMGAYSPYSAAPIRTDSTSFDSNFSTGETGSFAQFSYRTSRGLAFSAGGRLQTFAFGSHTTFTPRVSLRYHLGESAGIYAAFGTYTQLPPYVYLLAFPENRSMLPMRANHEIVGLDVNIASSAQVRLEAYAKKYTDTPVATEYPAVTLHTMPSLLGEQFVWLPMKSQGHGQASGIELSGSTRIRSRLALRGSFAYSRARFAGSDHILRPSNFDFPWIANLSTNMALGRGYGASVRWGYASGRPYTPYDLPSSVAQNRPIYDLSKINALRAPYYSRLDAQINKDILMKGRHLVFYGGVDNILNRENFLTFAWMPIFDLHSKNRVPVKQLTQMPIFPNFGVRFIVR